MNKIQSRSDERKLASYEVAGVGGNMESNEALSLADSPKLEKFLGRLVELWGA
jgi:hypothetical protein